MVSPPQQPDFIGAATAAAAVATAATPPAHKGTVQAVRAAEKAALPTLSGSTGLRAVENCTTVAMVPLCCGDAAAAVLNEKSKLKAINEANELMKNVVHGLLQKANTQIDIYTISPKRVVDVKDKVARESELIPAQWGLWAARPLAGGDIVAWMLDGTLCGFFASDRDPALTAARVRQGGGELYLLAQYGGTVLRCWAEARPSSR